ncbi:hypothetical protein NEPAR06_1214 [Nematocida parisii]|uniref:Uncharacterized protein n=2 Tax=Nematocida parisii TaxID=586133 RepID=I3EK47_NEMP3|nr:hypothetical protein NEQG_00364 [Nematocida parisii ERTm3]KAI5144863.1 hypothetical protein NEPAR07_1321 [Nematocida parisii]KAI5154560.1 hypothetical protein NEPAR06_1214 [Nematocida parisii]KAI5157600.1 hypothetical protein NEPAR05_1423 [Nematocida parisii]
MLALREKKEINEPTKTETGLIETPKSTDSTLDGKETDTPCTTPSDAFILEMPDTVLDYSEIAYSGEDESDEAPASRPKTTWEEYQRKNASLMEEATKMCTANAQSAHNKSPLESAYEMEESAPDEEIIELDEESREQSEELELEDEDLEEIKEAPEVDACEMDTSLEEDQIEEEKIEDNDIPNILEQSSELVDLLHTEETCIQNETYEEPLDAPKNASDNESLVFVSLEEESDDLVYSPEPMNYAPASTNSTNSDEEAQEKNKLEKLEKDISSNTEDSLYISATQDTKVETEDILDVHSKEFSNSEQAQKTLKTITTGTLSAPCPRNVFEETIKADKERSRKLPHTVDMPTLDKNEQSAAQLSATLPEKINTQSIPAEKTECVSSELTKTKEGILTVPAEKTSLFERLLTIAQAACLLPLLFLQLSSLQGYGVRLNHIIRSYFSADSESLLSICISLIPIIMSLGLSTRALINAFIVVPVVKKVEKKESFADIKVKGFYLIDLMQISLLLPFSFGMARPFVFEFFKKPERGWMLGKLVCELLYVLFIISVAQHAYSAWNKVVISKDSASSVVLTCLPRVWACASSILQVFLFRYILDTSLEIAMDHKKLLDLIFATIDNTYTVLEKVLPHTVLH